jgi:hypothetical protein
MARINLGNTPGYIALQVAPVMFRGGTGVGKSSSLEALAGALERTFIPLYGATHLPEDFSGYPIPDLKEGVVRMLPTSWVARAKKKRSLILIDEVTNVPSSTQGGLLSVLSERRVGDDQLPADTIMVGAMNPPELCPNAVPLAPAMRSRFCHFEWEVDYDHWFTGLRNGCEWTAPAFPVVPVHWTDLLAQFGSLVEAFLRSAPDAREKLPADDETLSFPNLRTWTYLVKVCAAAEACGYEWRKERKDPIYRTLCAAAVGTEHASMFLQYAQKLDLLNPEEFLSGSVDYTYENRPDANICLLTGIVKCLRSNPTKERWSRAAEAFIEVGSHEIESFLMQFKSFWKPVKDGGVRPDGWTPPTETLGKLMALVQS